MIRQHMMHGGRLTTTVAPYVAIPAAADSQINRSSAWACRLSSGFASVRGMMMHPFSSHVPVPLGAPFQV